MDLSRLEKACQGKSASAGGMNVPEIKALAQRMKHSGIGDRKTLLEVVCRALHHPELLSGASAPAPAPAPIAPAVPSAPAPIAPVAPKTHVPVPGLVPIQSGKKLTVKIPSPVKVSEPAAYVPQFQSERLRLACQGKSEGAGGMNIPEIKAIAMSRGHDGSGTRAQLLAFICGSNFNSMPVRPIAAIVPVAPIRPVKLPAIEGRVKDRTEEWKTRKPVSVAERQALKAKCGSKCFLVPEELKYPICSKNQDCKIDCDGLRAALGLATMVSRRNVSREAHERASAAGERAKEIGREHCGWKDA